MLLTLLSVSRQKTGMHRCSLHKAQLLLLEMLEQAATYFLPQRPQMLHQITPERLALHRDVPDRQRVGRRLGDVEQRPESSFQRKSPSVQVAA